MKLKRITPRTCLWPLVGTVCATFALSIGLTYRSNHHCYAGTCGEWLFPLSARLHVVVWYMWLSTSITFLALRAFRPSILKLVTTPLGFQLPVIGKQLRISGVLLVFWVCSLYGILIGIWWNSLLEHFEKQGDGLPGNGIVAAVGLTGHLADVTMGMVLLPVSRHSALASFFKLSPTTTLTFHMFQAYVLFGLVAIHGSLYAAWAALYNQQPDLFRHKLPVWNPTYLYHETWPGNKSALGVWRASLIFTGIASSLIMVAMFFTSFPAIRRKHFNLFYFTHLFGIVAVIIICLHATTMFYCTIPGLAMWLLDWGMRVYELRGKLDSRLNALGNGWYSLVLPLPRIRLSGCACHSPLAHFYIHHSQSSIREIHPFTTITHLASAKPSIPEDGTISIQFLFRQSVPSNVAPAVSQPALKKSTQWTNKLASLVDEEKAEKVPTANDDSPVERDNSLPVEVAKSGVETTLRLEGPYFTPATPEVYQTVVCLVAGTGLSGALAIAEAFRAERAKVARSSQVSVSTGDENLSSPGKEDVVWKRCIIIWTVRERDYVDFPFFHELQCDGLEFRVHKTGGVEPRVDMAKSLNEIFEANGEEGWCYVSGPNGFIMAAEKACSTVKGLKWFAARWD